MLAISSHFEQQVELRNSATAVIDGACTLSYAELNARANGIAHRILAEIGEEPAPVALLQGLGADAISSIYGVLKAGKFYVPLDVKSPVKRLRGILQEMNAPLLITDHTRDGVADELLGEIKQKLVVGEDFESEQKNPRVAVSQLDLAYVMYTSGSTGQPKGVMHTHANVLADMLRQGRDLKTDLNDCYGLLFAPSSSASCCSIFGGLLNGAAVSCFDLDRNPVSAMAAWLLQDKITICDINVAALRLFAASLTEKDRFPDMRLIAPGGEPLYRSDVELCRRIFGKQCVVQNSLGTTETRTVTQYFITSEMELETSMVPVGWPVDEKQVLLLDGNQSESDEGEIAVASRYLSTGYWNQPDLSSKVFLPNPHPEGERIYLTGDLAKRLPDGRLLHQGRKDFQVKIRGYRVEISEVEDRLLQLEGIEDVAVIAKPDHRGELCLQAYLVIAAGARLTVTQLRDVCRINLPRSSHPTRYSRVTALPKTNNGKLARAKLHEVEGEELQDHRTDCCSHSTDLEKRLCQIFEQVLGYLPMGIEDQFNDYGGDSIRVLDCILQIEKEIGVRVSPLTFLENQSAGELAAYLEDKLFDSASGGTVHFSSNVRPIKLFLFPGVADSVFDLKELATQVDERIEVIGLESLASEESADFTSLAAHYAERVASLSPLGPWCLAGYSFGGLLAYEAARQLNENGRAIDFLGLIDASPDLLPTGPLRHPMRFMANVPVWLLDEFRHDRFELINKKITHWLRRKLTAHQGSFESEGLTEQLSGRVESNLEKIQAYSPPASCLKISLFQTRIRPLMHSINPYRDWCDLTTEKVRRISVPGNHDSVLKPPHVYSLCNAFNEELLFCLRHSLRPADS